MKIRIYSGFSLLKLWLIQVLCYCQACAGQKLASPASIWWQEPTQVSEYIAYFWWQGPAQVSEYIAYIW